jgi:ubiquinone/menaquinone biosynthesis C-methylase UbiE
MMGINHGIVRERMTEEEAFHDRKFGSVGARTSYYDVGFKSLIFQTMLEKLGDIQGKRVLEYGCGSGWFTKKLAEKGAEVWAFDISAEAVDLTRSFLERENLSQNVHLDQMAAEDLTYDSRLFDLAVGNAVLHHVDLPLAMGQMKRVLKDGGRALFNEPLGHNPFLTLYRRTTPNLRSKDEKPLSFRDLKIIESNFNYFEHEEFYFTAIASASWHFLGSDSLMLKTRDFLLQLDEKLLRYFPFLRRYCWYTILECRK